MNIENTGAVHTNNITISIKAMRTIPQCVDLIRQIDNETCITEWFIRGLCKESKIRYLKSGSTMYVDFNSLVDYINNFEEKAG